MTTIEQQLSALQPARQTELTRRILEIPQRRRQRRRDYVVGVAGLLTGIAATLLVVMTLPGKIVEVPVVFVSHTEAHAELEAGSVTECSDRIAPEYRLKNPVAPAIAYAPGFHSDPDPIDLDALIARYEKLLRHRREAANRFVVVTPKTPSTMSDGVSPWEYRKKLLEELGG